MPRVLVLGGIAYNTMIYLDELPAPQPGTIFASGVHRALGSTGAGKALNLAGLGLDVTLHGLLGQDDVAPRAREQLAAAGVHLLYDLDPQGTKHHVNLMAANGDRLSIHVVAGSFAPAVDVAAVEPHIAGADLVALNIINYCRAFIPAIKAHGKPLWCDIHDYDGQEAYHAEFIAAADVVFMSSDRLPDWRAFMQTLVEQQGKQLVVCTHGRHGATALDATGTWHTEPILDAYQRVDTNGAGDAFCSGYIWGHLRGYPVGVCLRLGTVVSGLCITARELAHPELSAALVEAAYHTHYEHTLP